LNLISDEGETITRKTRQPRPGSGPAPSGKDSWKKKVHPVFIESAEYQKKVTLLTISDSDGDREEASRLSQNLPPDLIKRAEQLYDELKASGKLKRQSVLAIYGAAGVPPGTQISQAQYALSWFCWFKYNKTLPQLMEERATGKLRAIKQFNQLTLLFDKWRYGHIDPNRLKFKTDVDHFDLMIAGLDLGLESVTPNELADCFDALCPCGKEHDPENLEKLRERIDKAFPAVQP
jgi:hypothetical protein